MWASKRWEIVPETVWECFQKFLKMLLVCSKEHTSALFPTEFMSITERKAVPWEHPKITGEESQIVLPPHPFLPLHVIVFELCIFFRSQMHLFASWFLSELQPWVYSSPSRKCQVGVAGNWVRTFSGERPSSISRTADCRKLEALKPLQKWFQSENLIIFSRKMNMKVKATT